MNTLVMSTGPEWFGQPRGLFVCFATEMWERFSFYGMKYLLVLFLVQHHLFTDGEALRILGVYSALVYATPLLGGIVSDLPGICGNWDQAVPSAHDPICLPKVMSSQLTKVQTVAFPQRA